MAFNAASFLAGVGSVVVVISTGFVGGYFFASSDHDVPPNRLQRVASGTTATKDADAKAASVAIPPGDVVKVDQAEPPPGPNVRPVQFLRTLMAASAFPI